MPEPRRERLAFCSERHLRTFLQRHGKGKALLAKIVDDAIEERCRECNRPWEPVLVVIDGSGFLDVYGGSHVRVHVAERPYVCGRGSKHWAESHRLGDEYLDCTLPRVFAELFLPRNHRGLACVRQMTPEMIENRDWALAVLKGLRQK